MESYRLIPLSGKYGKGLSAIVDEADFEMLNAYTWRGQKSKSTAANTYVVTTVKTSGKKKHVRMHRLILNAPDGVEVDHENRNTLDNRRDNLRLCTHAQNCMNRGGKGINFRAGAWDAYIYLRGSYVHLGRYPNRELASRARDAARLHHYGSFANVAYPDVKPVPAKDVAVQAPSLMPRGASGFYGVKIAKRGNQAYWTATIQVDGKTKHLGYFPTPEAAAHAYDEAAQRLRGDKARLNFPLGADS